MGAVSGDINTLSLSVSNAADLASRPIAGLQSGDRAYVADKVGTPEGPCFYLNKSSAAAADGVGIITASGGVGRWLSEAFFGAGSDLVVADTAALAALPSSLADGAEAYVLSLETYFVLDRTSTEAVSDLVVIAANGGGNWYRDLNYKSLRWNLQGDWFVDAVNGSDERDGASIATSLRTFAELRRRMPNSDGQPMGDVSVWLLSDMAERPRFYNLPIKSWVQLRAHESAITVLGTGTITAMQIPDASAGGAVLGTGNASELEAAALGASWTALGYMYKAIRITNPASPAYGAVAFAAFDLGGANNRVRTSPFYRFAGVPVWQTGSFVNPQVGDTFEVLDLPLVLDPSTRATSWDSVVKVRLLSVYGDWEYDAGDGPGTNTWFESCSFIATADGYAINCVSGADVVLASCLIQSSAALGYVEFDVWTGARILLSGTAVVDGNAFIYPYQSSIVWAYRNTLLQSGGCIDPGTFASPQISMVLSDVGVFNADYRAVSLPVLSTLEIPNLAVAGAGGYIYGNNNAQPIIRLDADARAVYGDATRLKAGMSAGQPLLFGASAQAWAALPFRNTALATDNQATMTGR